MLGCVVSPANVRFFDAAVVLYDLYFTIEGIT